MRTLAVMDWSLLDEESGHAKDSPRTSAFQAAMLKQQTALLGNILEASAPVRTKVLNTLKGVIKQSSVADPDMGPFMTKKISHLIDLLWGDLMITIDMALADVNSMEYGNHIALSKQGETLRICTPAWWRARLLYNQLPFDKSILGQFKDPIFWYFFFVSVVITYGVRIIYCSVLLLFICWDRRPDEFQLISFILMFKGTTFLASGVGMSIYATLGYWACVKPDGTHTCHIDGPTRKLDVTSTGIDFCGCCLLTWIAFGLLLAGKSKHNGYKKVSDKEWGVACKNGHGGHLRSLFGYDVAVVVVCILVFLTIAWWDAKVENPSIRDKAVPSVHDLAWLDLHRAFFFSKVIYGLLSAPFLIFRLPVLSTVLCHTSPTGYNRNGVCVPFLLPPMPVDSASKSPPASRSLSMAGR